MQYRPIIVLTFVLALGQACNSPSTPSKTIAPSGDEQASAEFSHTKQEKILAALVGRMLETEHLRSKPIDDEVSKSAFKRFMEQLDGGKLYLLQEDVEALSKHTTAMDDQIRDGRLVLAHEGAAALKRRIGVVKTLIADQLTRPFDFSKQELIETDPDKIEYCKSEQELRERWRKVLKYQVLLRIARMEAVDELREEANKTGEHINLPKNVPATEEGREKKARDAVANSHAGRLARLEKLEPLDFHEMFVNAIGAVFDPHTSYLPPERKEDFDIDMSGSLEGIGAVLSEHEHYIQVVEIVPGSASWRQGELDTGDVILAVAEGSAEPVDVTDMRLRDVVRLIRGKKGTGVVLTVKKSDERIVVIPITRDVVKIEASYARGALLKHKQVGRQVGYIYLPSFYGNTRARRGNTPERYSANDVRKLLDYYAEKKIGAVILDLRSNGGGLLWDAREMSGLFIESGPIVQTRGADGDRDVLKDDNPTVSFRGDVVVMVDRFSASASEIVAGALQDYGRAVVVGTAQTHGKGTVQMLVSLDQFAAQMDLGNEPLGVLKLTRQQFYRVTGASTQHRGVVPDIQLPDPSAHIESGERHLDFSIPWSSVEPLRFRTWRDRSWNVEQLVDRSRARLKDNQVFARVNQRIELLRARRDQTEEPLSLSAWRAKRDKEKKELETLALKDSEPARFAVKRVDYDGTLANQKVRPRPGKRDHKASARADRWDEGIARDVWIEEALLVLGDMAN